MGSYLVPRLVESGHEVLQVSRQQRSPYQPHGAWRQVRQVSIDRTLAEEAGTIGAQIAARQPDAVIDLICITHALPRHPEAPLRGPNRHFLHCGTIWVHGPSTLVPTTESQPRRPFGDYGIQKAAIEAYLLEEAQRGHFPATNLHPGHIVGPGWVPLNPAGHFNPQVFVDLANGEEVALPNLGMETVHHVHADDVAHAFTQALAHWSSAIGESYHVVSPAAVTLRGYAEAVAGWFGHPARLRYLPWEAWRQSVRPEEAQATWDHIAHSPHCSIEKARRQIAYSPRYSSLQAVRESLDWWLAAQQQ